MQQIYVKHLLCAKADKAAEKIDTGLPYGL